MANGSGNALNQHRQALLASLAGVLVLILPIDIALAQFSSSPMNQRSMSRGYPQRQVIQGQSGRMMVPQGMPRSPYAQPGIRRPTPGEDGRISQPQRPPRGPYGDGPGRPGGGRPGGRGPGIGIGIGLGILGGIGAAAANPVYEPYPYPEQPRRPRYPRYPVEVDPDDYADEPVMRPRRPRAPPVMADPAPRQPRIQRAAPPPPPPPQPRTVARHAPRPAPPVSVPAPQERRYVADEILVELAAGTDVEANIARRHRLSLISSQRFTLANATLSRFRVEGGRSARTVLTQMAGDRQILTAQPNYVYSLQQETAAATSPTQTVPETTPAGATATETRTESPPVAQTATGSAAPVEGTAPAYDTVIAPPDLPDAPIAAISIPRRELQPQYVLERIGVEAAHRVARGERVKVAVIDSGADRQHPELFGTIRTSFDAVGGDNPQPHLHGTAMSAAIVAQASLQGIAPAAELLSARAFSGGKTGTGAEGTTFHILKSLDWSAEQGARVVNLSFAGPQDRLLSRALEGTRSRRMIAIAAAGNGGPKATALYPGADPNVIAVTATDADDKPFPQANLGAYIAVAAPGVDILAASPGARYEFSSGTSIAAAHVSGLVALMLEKNPDLDLASVRAILSETAIDLGAKGKDTTFGAGRIDASAALARIDTPTTAQR